VKNNIPRRPWEKLKHGHLPCVSKNGTHGYRRTAPFGAQSSRFMHLPSFHLRLLMMLALVPGAALAARPPAHLPAPASRALQAAPPAVMLDGPESEQTLLVTVVDGQGIERDATRAARYTSSNPAVVRVLPGGLLRIAGNGSAEVRV